MTTKLYYDDVNLLEFSAKLGAQKVTEHGTAASLDRSAFYPTSGGQPHDTGTLNEVPVIDVWEDVRERYGIYCPTHWMMTL